SRRVLEKRRGAAVWAKIWRRSERRLKFLVRDGGDSVLTITRWLKAARARAGHSPPAIWAMAKRGRQLSARRLKAVAGNGGSQLWSAAKLSWVQRANLRQSSASIFVFRLSKRAGSWSGAAATRGMKMERSVKV